MLLYFSLLVAQETKSGLK